MREFIQCLMVAAALLSAPAIAAAQGMCRGGVCPSPASGGYFQYGPQVQFGGGSYFRQECFDWQPPAPSIAYGFGGYGGAHLGGAWQGGGYQAPYQYAPPALPGVIIIREPYYRPQVHRERHFVRYR